MGRRRQIDLELPPRMRKKGNAFYHVGGSPQKWRSLGTDKATALIRWAEIEGANAPVTVTTVRAVWDRYEREVVPTKAVSTQRDNRREAEKLLLTFGAMQIGAITTRHVMR